MWLKPDFPTRNMQASLTPHVAFTWDLYQPHGGERVSQSTFNLPFSYCEGDWEAFHKHIGRLNSIFCCPVHSMSFVLFPVCYCLLLRDLSETLTLSRMSSSVCRLDLFSVSIMSFWVLLCFPLQEHLSPLD